MSNLIFNIPYLLYFIPFLASIAVYFLGNRRFLVNLTYAVLAILILLSLRLIAVVNDDVLIINSTLKYNIIGTEFKVTFYNVFFLASLLFINFIGFLNYIKEIILSKYKSENQLKHFFSTYFIYIFSTIGIILTDNIFHLFIFLEIYSFCVYMIITSYRNKNLTILSYKYFSSNIFGSILNMISIFYMTIYFNTSSIFSIKQQLETVSIRDNYEIILIFMLFVFSLIIRFFNNSVSRYHNTDYSGINFISISNIFTNTLIGIYLMINIIFYIFPTGNLLSTFYLDKIVVFIVSLIIIYNSSLLFKQEHINSIFSIFIRIDLISMAYLILTMFLKVDINVILSFVIDYISVNLLLYFFSDYISLKYNTNEINILNNNKFIKAFFLFILLYKLYLPIGTSGDINKTLVLYAFENKSYYLLLPFIANKIALLFVIFNVLIDRINLNPENIKNNNKLYRIIFSIVIIFVFVLFSNII